MNAIFAPSPVDLVAATERANRWVDAARPIIRTMFAIEDADGRHLFHARIEARGDRRWDAPRTWGERTFDEAQKHLMGAHTNLHGMLDGIRANFLADEMLPQPAPDASEQEWTDRDEFSDALDEAVISVGDAIKQIGAEL